MAFLTLKSFGHQSGKGINICFASVYDPQSPLAFAMSVWVELQLLGCQEAADRKWMRKCATSGNAEMGCEGKAGIATW